MTGRSLAYPLHSETLMAGLMFYLVLGVFYGTFTIVIMNIVATVLWLVMEGVFVLLFSGMLFEYGTDLLLASSRGEARPPAARADLATPRAFAFAFLYVFFGAIAWRLGAAGWTGAALGVWAALLLLMPALILNNVLISAGAMLNPVNLALALRRMGWSYFRDLLLLAVAAALLVAALSGPFVRYLVCFPVFIYVEFLLFHLMGRSVHARYEEYFPPVDFKADRAESQAISDSLADIDRELSTAYEWLRAGEGARVLEKVDVLVKRNGWAVFEKLFSYVSQWHNPNPAVHLCRRYLNQRELPAVPMRALELAQWCLGKDATFTLPNEVLQEMAERAVIPAHYRAVLQLIENHLAQFPDTPHKAELLAVALSLAADKLQDEARLARLKAAYPG